ncbi:MAG: hypothetical protein U5K36_00320 [Roseovarius sp.]|nr:hypothetical protein [Roseovarius sp.]
MNKHLLSTSAIALGVAMAAPAAAQEWNMDWGGFANTHVGIVDVSGTGVDRPGLSTASMSTPTRKSSSPRMSRSTTA